MGASIIASAMASSCSVDGATAPVMMLMVLSVSIDAAVAKNASVRSWSCNQRRMTAPTEGGGPDAPGRPLMVFWVMSFSFS